MGHAHLNHGEIVFRLEGQQPEWQTKMIIEIALGAVYAVLDGEQVGHRFFGGGLAHRAGDADSSLAPNFSDRCRQRLERGESVVDGEQAGGKTATFIGEILDADILFNPAIPLATPGALGANPGAYDLESLLIHELGHSLGFSHSGVLRAMMFPFAPPPGTFLGQRPSVNAPDAPLADDDRAGLRILYPGSQVFGSISGRILPVNPFSLAGLMAASPGLPVTGYFGTHVVAVDADSGALVAAALGGYTCDPVNQVSVFDGSYEISGLPLGRRYTLYVEPLDGALPPGEISGALLTTSSKSPPRC